MAKTMNTYDDLMSLAKRWSVADNALFVACAKQYSTQQKVIDNIRKALEAEDSLTVEKQYVKETPNIYANPLVRELPKHADSANKTLNTMLDIIIKLGKEPSARSALEDMIDE